MNLMPLVNRINATRLGTKGKDLFVEMMPPEVSSAILLRSPLSGTKIDYYLPQYFNTEFQLIVRTGSYESGLDLTKRVITLLTFDELALESQSFKFCRPRTLPVAFPLSRGNLVEYNVMFDCCFVGPG